ncbi:MAG: chaperonin GroEL [candidate division SR1 bacterium]|nr:chaperonin GroEL [candidate division SR1 bacterium]
MSKKIIKFGTEARKAIQEGVNTVVKAVQTSYGPLGRTSIIEGYGDPQVTNDGVTIAKAVELEGPEQMGVKLIQQAASKTNDIAGDGTSLTTVLTGAFVNEGLKVVESGSDPIQVRSGIQKAVKFALEKLETYTKVIATEEEMADVATISSRNRDIGQMIARMINKVGKDGVVTVQTGDSNKIEEELTEGMQFDKGYKSPYMVTDVNRMEAILDKPYILVTDKKISSIQELVPVIEAIAQQGKKELVIIADDIDGEALATLVLNKMRGIFSVLAVQAPGFGESRKAILEDIAVLTGATFISSDLGMQLKTLTITDLGSSDKIISTKDNTTIVGGKGDKKVLSNRVETIRQSLNVTKSDYEKEKLQERLAKLVGGVGVIKVGASTEVEMKEFKYLVEDALNATKAAVSEGVVPGGASSLVRISKQLESLQSDNSEENIGISIVKKALLAPFRAMAQNSGVYDISILVNQIESEQLSGYDFKKMIMVEDMIKEGIIDPVLVLKQALQNSSSVACSILTTEVAICDEPKKEEASAMPSGMGGMGMGY